MGSLALHDDVPHPSLQWMGMRMKPACLPACNRMPNG